MLPLQGLRENSGTGFRLLLNPLRGEEKKEEMLSGFLLFLFSAIHTLRLFKNIYVSPNRDSRKKCRNLFIMMEASVLDLRVSVKALFIYRYQCCGTERFVWRSGRNGSRFYSAKNVNEK